jgi:TonB-dependent receptor-like protein
MNKYTALFVVVLLLSVAAKAQEDTTGLKKNEIPLPTFNLDVDDLGGLDESQNISPLLQSSRDIFVSRAGYTFGPARFRIRGYDSQYTSIMINGVEVNDPESGRAYWGSWGGLNDALRDQDIKTGVASSRLGFGGIGGITNIVTRASNYRKQFKVSMSAANRSYRNRLMFIASSGMQKNGWAYTVSGSRRWATEGYVDGTFYDAYSYFVSLEKKINDKHSLGLVAYGSPNKRGKSSGTTQEAYDLAGSNYYNPYWGYQDGKVRNARVSNYHQPMIMLSHYWTPDSKTTINTTAYLNFGRGGSTALGWADAGDPRPDYYKNMPSYFYGNNDFEGYENAINQWENNEQHRQIDWDYLYFANSKFLSTYHNVDGIDGNTVSGNQSKFIVEEWRNDMQIMGINSVLNRQIKDNANLSFGINVVKDKTAHYKTIVDLLGGDFWVDINKYADRESSYITDASQSDLRNPNRLVGVGDVFGYDYDANIDRYRAFGQIEVTNKMLDYYVGAELSSTTMWRTGNMQNGQFPDNSYGDSEKQSFFDYGAKAGATFKINGRNFITANTAYLTKAPTFRSAYISPRTRDNVIDGLDSEKIMSGDMSYIMRTPKIKTRLTFYYTEMKDQIWARSFYMETAEEPAFVNYILTGIDKLYTGLEFGVDVQLTPTVSLNGVFGSGEYIFNSRPNITIAEDESTELIADNEVSYMKDYYVGGSPQTVGSVGAKYSSPKYWFVSVNANYFDDIYLSPNPSRRTEQALSNFMEGDIRVDQILDQEKLPEAFTLDIFGGKSWRIDEYFVSLTISVNNVFDKTDFQMGGYEQYRLDPDNINKFPPKYFYLYGRTYFISLSVRM